jgi:hypothetical protein
MKTSESLDGAFVAAARGRLLDAEGSKFNAPAVRQRRADD